MDSTWISFITGAATALLASTVTAIIQRIFTERDRKLTRKAQQALRLREEYIKLANNLTSLDNDLLSLQTKLRRANTTAELRSAAQEWTQRMLDSASNMLVSISPILIDGGGEVASMAHKILDNPTFGDLFTMISEKGPEMAKTQWLKETESLSAQIGELIVKAAAHLQRLES